MTRISSHKKQKGFTLLEILIALFIFAIIGIMAAVGLHSVLKTHDIISERDQQIEQLEITMTLMRRDFIQIVDRPIVNEKGNTLPPVMSVGSSKIEFTHSGFSNPFAIDNRSTMQRVAYFLEKGKLIRETWPVLDRVSTTKPDRQTLLKQVSALNFKYLDDLSQIQTSWPLATGSNIQMMSHSNLPKAIMIEIQLKQWGNVSLVFPISSRGFYAMPTS